MAEPITRTTWLVPGPRSLRDAAPADAEWVDNAGDLANGFSFGTVEPDVVAAIADAPGALVVSTPHDLRDGRAELVALVERLRDAGALAVRLEQSKLGWAIADWLEVYSSDDAWAWHRSAVVFLGGDSALHSCGMHAFSLPDAQIELAGDPAELQKVATFFNIYQIVEDPLIRSGQTFTPAREVPRRVVERWPDTAYPPGHACHNPYGVWRIGPPGGTARSLTELVPVYMPSLFALLGALEDKAGKPLTQRQVEAARDQAITVALDPRDAQRLERERGYADLEPELAWEQWQLMRNA